MDLYTLFSRGEFVQGPLYLTVVVWTPLVDCSHLQLVNSNHTYLAKSDTFIGCTVGKHVHEYGR